jgi:hypothetical protein
MLKASVAGILGFVFLVGAARSALGQDQKSPPASAPKDYLLAEISSLSGLLYELAAERFAANSNRNETWILTVHHGTMIRRFNDGKFTLLSLPIRQPTDRIAMCRYTAQYNAFNLQAADRLVKAGKYKEAEEIYRLVLHFERCGDEIMKEQVEKKLAFVDKLKKGDHPDLNLRTFMELCDELGTLVDFTQVEKLSPTIVTNILSVRLP